MGKKINFQEGNKIEIFIFTTGGADPKAVWGNGGDVSYKLRDYDKVFLGHLPKLLYNLSRPL